MSSFKLLKFHSDIFSIFWVSGDRLLDGFEPIVTSRERLERMAYQKVRKKYIFPFLLTTYLILDTVYHYFRVGYDPSKPVLYPHVIISFLPEFFRVQNDIVHGGSFACISVFYLVRIFDTMPHASQVLAYQTDDGILVTLRGQRTSRSLSEKLSSFWRKTKMRLRFFTYLVELECQLAFTYPLLVIEIYRIFYGPSFRPRFLYCGILSWLYLHYVSVGVEASIMFIVNNLYLNIKQKHYLQKMNIISYQSFEATLRAMQDHTSDMRLLNNFFTIPITASIVGFGFTSGSLLNGAFHSPEVPVLFLVPWVAFALFYMGLIGIFTASSSETIALNRKLFLKLRSQQASICSLTKINNRRRIIQLDRINEYKGLLLRTCFRLVTSMPLNNRSLFFEISGLLLVVYVKTVNRNDMKCDPICLKR